MAWQTFWNLQLLSIDRSMIRWNAAVQLVSPTSLVAWSMHMATLCAWHAQLTSYDWEWIVVQLSAALRFRNMRVQNNRTAVKTREILWLRENTMYMWIKSSLKLSKKQSRTRSANDEGFSRIFGSYDAYRAVRRQAANYLVCRRWDLRLGILRRQWIEDRHDS